MMELWMLLVVQFIVPVRVPIVVRIYEVGIVIFDIVERSKFGREVSSIVNLPIWKRLIRVMY